MFENIRIAFVGLGSNKLRSGLTMLGITIGVAAVIILVSIGQAVEFFILGQFQSIGSNLVVVFGEDDDRGFFVPLTQSDANALSDPYRVPDALAVSPNYIIFAEAITYGDRESDSDLAGVTEKYIEVVNRTVVAGRFIDENDVLTAARVAVIGQAVVDKLLPDVYPLEQIIEINNVSFRVIGVLNEAGGGAFGNDQDNIIFLPLTTAQQRLSSERTVGGERPITQVLLQARDGDSVDALVQQIRQVMREERGISFRSEDDFQVFTQSDLLSSFGAITSLLTIFLGVIAGISLLVGGIGIMNIMMVTVTERTREIGLRKAVGAQKRDILLQFLVEAIVLALVGGAVGISIATGMAAMVSSAVPDLQVNVQPSSMVMATTISLLIGVFFGIYPANRAASLNPIDALRYE